MSEPGACCGCGNTNPPGIYFDKRARGWFSRDGRECSLRIRRQRRNAIVIAVDRGRLVPWEPNEKL